MKWISSNHGIRNIIPVTLTPEEAQNEEDKGGSPNPITDISIVCSNENFSDLLIIEVKNYGSSAHAQVTNQANKIKDYVLGDYLEYVNENYPSWFPVRRFEEGMNSSLVWKRINAAAKACMTRQITGLFG